MRHPACIGLLLALVLTGCGDDGPALALAQTYQLRGQEASARAYADTAQAEFAAQLERAPDDGQLHALRGLALAYLGRKAEAIAEGRRGAELMPVSRSALSGPYMQHVLARIYLLVDEPDQALDRLEGLLRVPYFVSPAWLRIDPAFAALKGNPRFERLVGPA